MKQPIAGVVPSDAAETTIMTVWPSIAVYKSGQFLGRLCEIKWPKVYIFRLGYLFALLSIPHAVFLYFCRIAPRIGIRYRLTNRRVIIERGLNGMGESAIGLEEFDTIQIVVQPGHEWYPAGDLVFLRDGTEVFRLGGVSRPEGFQQVCLKAHLAFCSVAEVQRQQQPTPLAVA